MIFIRAQARACQEITPCQSINSVYYSSRKDLVCVSVSCVGSVFVTPSQITGVSHNLERAGRDPFNQNFIRFESECNSGSGARARYNTHAH